uniref:Condensin complex subunit 1 C-terminal domain-containing protein n=1 Tax=Glossina palpalis gambiensis TaxID=67801 RepID=A0A1B0ANX6_9MUSC
MSELIVIFQKLNEFLDHALVWEQIEEIYEAQRTKNTITTAPNETEESSVQLMNLPLIQKTLANDQIGFLLLDLCTTIRSLRTDPCESYDNTYDCWDQLIKAVPRDSYLAFVYAIGGLLQVSPMKQAHIKISLLVVDVYFLSLTIPGAKGYHIFHEDIITHCLQVFAHIERIQNPEFRLQLQASHQQIVSLWLQFSTLCDDLKLVLRYVHLSDHQGTRNAILRKLIDIQYLNHEKGYANAYAVNLHQKCFEIFEEMINAHNGEPEQTLLKLMNMTVFLHTYPSRPKSQNGNCNTADNECEHISDWFIKCIGKYARLLVKVLNFYIECIVTNPVKSWKGDQVQKALEYAAKYDANLFTKCNESCVQFLCEAIYADEVMIRSRAIDLIAKILQTESKVDWQMFRHEVSNTPREVLLIKELIDSLQDQNNNIKLKAVQALNLVLTRGSPIAQQILNECVKFTTFFDENVHLPDEPRVGKNEIRFEKPNGQQPQYTFEGHGIVESCISKMPSHIFEYLYQSPMSYIRRAGIMFMEQLVKLNPLLIFNTNFVTETAKLIEEPTALVRKQTLLSLDAILESYPNCYPVIFVWCKIIAPMLHDNDPKNTELAMECFRSRVLLNIKGIDQSNRPEHFMPWVIIRTMLSTQSRFYLQNCFHLALHQRMLSPQIIGIIESHLLTSNSTEAWIVLNFISGKIKSKEPDILIHQFISLESVIILNWNKEQNMLIAIEVLASCIQDFSYTALNHAFNHILSHIKDGQMLPIIVGKAFDFLLLIDNRSQMTEKRKQPPTDTANKPWITDLHEHLEKAILEGISDFPDNRDTLMCHLYAFTEVNLQTRLRPNQTIISFIHKFITECAKLKESELHLDNERLFNSMILLAGRLSLRDSCVARTTCMLYAHILKLIDRPPIINTILVALSDLCKKHTQIVENITDRILCKLNSPYDVNRLETFKCFEKLVLQDQLKLRGSLLLCLLSTLLDVSKEISSRASDFFSEFLSKKNPTLFQKCLIECPFVFNEFKNFDGLDSFAEAHIKSPLKGESHQKSRQLLYEHFLKDMDDINMILYFGQLKLDIFYILKRVCQLAKEQKSSNDTQEEAEDMIDINEIVENEEGGGNSKAASKSAAKNPGIGRGRRKRETTMPEAMTVMEKSLIFIPTIYENLNQPIDPEVEKSFNGVCKALAKKFPNLMEYAQPPKFWKKYNCKVNTNPRKRKSRNRRENLNDDADEVDHNSSRDNSDESDFDSDESDGEPLITKRRCVDNSLNNANKVSDLPIEYIFNPNI